MHVAQAAAVRVQRQLAARAGVPRRDELARLATLAEPEVLETVDRQVRAGLLDSPGLKLTVGKANGAIDGVDRNFIARLPALMDKLDATVAKLDSAAGNADALISENRPAVNSFANDGLAQLGPTLAELRRLIRDLRNLSDRLEDKPASYILGRDAPKEFEPK